MVQAHAPDACLLASSHLISSFKLMLRMVVKYCGCSLSAPLCVTSQLFTVAGASASAEFDAAAIVADLHMAVRYRYGLSLDRQSLVIAGAQSTIYFLPCSASVDPSHLLTMTTI